MTVSAAAPRPLRWVSRFPVTLAYSLGVAVVAVVLGTRGERLRDEIISWASTNLHNLSEGRMGTLVTSAFVTEEDVSELWLWLPGLACLLALGELLWRPGRLAGMFTLGHVGATVIVALGLVVVLRLGWVGSSVVDDDDVGVSYGSMAVIGALVGSVPSALRVLWAVGWTSLALWSFATNRDFTSVGHLVALGLGLGVGAVLVSRAERTGWRPQWSPVALCLLAGACAFGAGILFDVDL